MIWFVCIYYQRFLLSHRRSSQGWTKGWHWGHGAEKTRFITFTSWASTKPKCARKEDSKNGFSLSLGPPEAEKIDILCFFTLRTPLPMKTAAWTLSFLTNLIYKQIHSNIQLFGPKVESIALLFQRKNVLNDEKKEGLEKINTVFFRRFCAIAFFFIKQTHWDTTCKGNALSRIDWLIPQFFRQNACLSACAASCNISPFLLLNIFVEHSLPFCERFFC